jgi:hypothetical protein
MPSIQQIPDREEGAKSSLLCRDFVHMPVFDGVTVRTSGNELCCSLKLQLYKITTYQLVKDDRSI